MSDSLREVEEDWVKYQLISPIQVSFVRIYESLFTLIPSNHQHSRAWLLEPGFHQAHPRLDLQSGLI